MTFIGGVLLFARRRRWLVLTATAVFSVSAALLCSRVSFGTDVLGLLPQNTSSLQAFRHYLERFDTTDQLFIIFEVPAGGQIGDASAEIDAYLTRLRALPEIKSVDAGFFDPGKDWTYFQDRTFALIGPTATRDVLRRLDEAGMREALSRSRDLLTMPSREMGQLVQSDPLGLLSLVRDHFAGDRAFAGMDISRRGYLSEDGRSRLVLAAPTGAPFDSAFCRRLFARLAEIEAAARRESATDSAASAPAVHVAYAGGHRIAFETEAVIRREARLNTVTSVAAILILLLVVFRSSWLFLVGAIPMSIATLGAIAVNGLVADQLSAAATGTAALLFGLGIDGLVLMYARYLEELESGASAEHAIGCLGGAGTSMLLGCVTTAATFFGLTWIDLPGLQELGRLVGMGMLLGGPLTLILVAALLPARPHRSRGLSATWLPGLILRRRWVILAGTGIITAVAVPLVPALNLDLRLQRLQPDTGAVRLQQELGQRFGVDRDVALAIADGPDLNALLTIDRHFETEVRARPQNLAVSGVSRLLPPPDEQTETGRILASVASDIPAMQARLRRTAFEMGFRTGAVDAFVDRLPQLLSPEQRLTYRGYVEHGLTDLVSRYVVPTGAGFTTVSYVEIDQPGDLAVAEAAATAVGTPLTLTGLPVVNANLANRFQPQFILALAAGCVAVFVLILVTFRSIGLTLLALSPTVLGLIWAAAVVAMLGVSLDLFSIFAVLTLVGIGVDYGIHLVHRAATEPGRLDVALARVAPANVIAAGIALLGCGSLMTSSYPPLRSLGIVTVVGLCTCLITAVVVLPAILMLLPMTSKEATSQGPTSS